MLHLVGGLIRFFQISRFWKNLRCFIDSIQDFIKFFRWPSEQQLSSWTPGKFFPLANKEEFSFWVMDEPWQAACNPRKLCVTYLLTPPPLPKEKVNKYFEFSSKIDSLGDLLSFVLSSEPTLLIHADHTLLRFFLNNPALDFGKSGTINQ